MQTWLHFIGKQYYTRASFLKEARREGVTRRVSLATLKRMRFGDRVLCAMLDGKSAVAFATFQITGLSGLSKAAVAALSDGVQLTPVDLGGALVRRGCGSYMAGPCYQLAEPVPLTDLVATLAKLDDPGKLMVSGRIPALTDDLGVDLVRLKDVPHTHGFRLWDWDTFRADVAAARQEGETVPVVRGCYYADPSRVDAVAVEALIQEVTNYGRA